jgi:hypothetical protein
MTRLREIRQRAPLTIEVAGDRWRYRTKKEG